MYVTSHDRTRAEIRQYVSTHTDVCPTEISIALNLSPLKVRAVLIELLQDGVIEQLNDEI